MNTGLKALLNVLLDATHLGIDASGKKDFSTVLVGDLLVLGKDIPAAVSNYSALKTEIAGLTIEANRLDLEAYILGKIVGETAKAQAIIAAVIAMLEAGEKLYFAIKA